MTPDKPFETEYRRWRHVKHGYVVEILSVHNFHGDHGYYSTVRVKGSKQDPKKETTWPSDKFRKEFEPTGRKKKSKSAIERIRDSEDF